MACKFGARTRHVIAIAAFAALCAAAPSHAQERCAGSPVDVTTDSMEERELVCAGASDAIQILQRCEIYIRRPLDIRVVEEVRHPAGTVAVGLFDPIRERVLISPYRKAADLVGDTPYKVLPLRDFYRSLVVHEIVHAIMHQNFSRRSANYAVYEYPAYALQIASLPPGAREQFLDTVAQGANIDTPTLNDFILSFDPFLFAARAYRHFSVSPNGCAHLTALLDGKAEFISLVQ